MSRYVSPEQFRQRFEVVPTDDLSARGSSDLSAREPTSREPREEPTSRDSRDDLTSRDSRDDLTAREPTKYYDPFAEREDV